MPPLKIPLREYLLSIGEGVIWSQAVPSTMV